MKKNLLVLFIIIISLFSCSKDTIKEKTNFKTAVEYEEKEDYENAIKYYKLAIEKDKNKDEMYNLSLL